MKLHQLNQKYPTIFERLLKSFSNIFTFRPEIFAQIKNKYFQLFFLNVYEIKK